MNNHPHDFSSYDTNPTCSSNDIQSKLALHDNVPADKLIHDSSSSNDETNTCSDFVSFDKNLYLTQNDQSLFSNRLSNLELSTSKKSRFNNFSISNEHVQDLNLISHHETKW